MAQTILRTPRHGSSRSPLPACSRHNIGTRTIVVLYCRNSPLNYSRSNEVKNVPKVNVAARQTPACGLLFFRCGFAGTVAEEQGHGGSAAWRALERGKGFGGFG